jgi:hypothetical protein
MNDRPTHGWCPTCREDSAVDRACRCLWCGGETEQRRPAKRGGWKRPDLRSKLTDDQLRALHVAHMQGRSINSLAKDIYLRVGYSSHGSCATAISKQWKRLGLSARDRIEQTGRSSTKHGRKRRAQTRAEQNAYRRWLAEQRGWRAIQGPGRPRCAAVKKQHPGKGDPCQRPALEDSEFCQSHDPRRQLAHQAHMAKLRARRPRKPLVPLEPFAQWCEQRAAELGSNRALAERLGVSASTVSDYIKRRDGNRRPKTEIGVEVVERCLEAEGSASFDELYNADRVEIAA